MPINKIAHSSFEVERENYISILRAGQSISDTGWRTYADAAGTAPVDGTGGTANITWAQNTSAPLSGDADLRMVKDAANRQGQGVSIDFTVANRHLAKVLQITFDMELISGTYSAGDLRVYIVQDPNGTPVVIEPVNVQLSLPVVGVRTKHIASFQTHLTLTTYRLCVHNANPGQLAFTVDFNNFRVWEPQQNYGAIITDWVSYTPTITGFTTISNNNFRSRRVGSVLEIEGYFTGATPTASEFRIPLPSGLTVNTNQTIMLCGQMATSIATNSFFKGYWLISQNGLGYVNYSVIENTTGSATGLFMGNSGNAYLTGTNNYSVKISVPIAGWGSTLALSSDAGDGRVVAAQVTGTHTGGGVDSAIIFPTVVRDTHGAYNSTTGRYTAPVSGFYRVSGLITGTNTTLTCRLWIDGAPQYRIGVNNPGSAQVVISGFAFLNAGQVVDVRPITALGTAGASDGHMYFERISAGSQQIAATETVSLGYIKLADQTETSLQFAFPSRIHDTHGSWNTSTGTFTAPMAGFYDITFLVGASSSNNYFEIWKNGSYFQRYLKSGSNMFTVFATMRLIAGDTIQLRPLSPNSTTLTGGDYNGNSSFVYINRIGI